MASVLIAWTYLLGNTRGSYEDSHTPVRHRRSSLDWMVYREDSRA